MFNSYNIRPSQSQSIKINAVTGAILKNHPKSWFERFHLESQRAEELFVEGGHQAQEKQWSDRYGYHFEKVPEKDIVILQMVICGDMEVMAELVYRKDYESSFGGEKE